ncbi:MAG: 1-deoxy-D-xylulose-5-phosphate synthase, partial [Eubacteriales bacterium]|nr:1-deoxy-D-xylulose-5-phosphate synthase [Eubacteriales bacterium]MDD3349468.1 1-deoxy-D-xylulose-5-phosphate synthase [Eubacteriales bacterium]
MNRRLSEHDFPAELKSMSEKELELLSYQIRDFLIEKIAQSGGHLASNLGVVELTIALHRVFDSPKDKLLFDVGHQSYVHKILTGRAKDFDTLRATNGLSGFLRRAESKHDMHDSGHASTSISVGMGYAASRDLNGEDFDVVSVIGDGAMTGGVAFEAMNNAGCVGSKMIVVLNDNEMSIDKNNGALSKHLGRLRTTQSYLDLKKQVKKALQGIPGVGSGLVSGIEHIKDSVRYAVIQGAIFEGFGFKYLGPVDGHNIHDLLEVLTVAKMIEGPVLVHVVTQKGKGYRNAEINPSKFHGISAFDPETGETIASNRRTYSSVFGSKLIELAAQNEKIVAVSAAMVEATGLGRFEAQFPKRLFDVGIAEQHAVSFA